MNTPSSKRRFSAVVVGAGPAGSTAALCLARTGLFDVHLLDRAAFPRVKPCGGGLGPGALRALRALGLRERLDPVTYPIQALKLTTARGRTTMLAGPAAASVLRRERLDTLLCEAARGEGVRFSEAFPVHRFLRHGGKVCGVSGPGGELEADLTILAAGGRSSLRPVRQGNFKMLACAWQPVTGARCVPHTVEMVLDRAVLPGYAWLFPEGDGMANIGVCMDVGKIPSNQIRQTLERIRNTYFASALRDADLGVTRVAPIRCSLWPQPLAEPGLWVAGEAAGLANWATGEGIAQAIRSAGLLGRAAARFDEAGEAPCRKHYQAACKTDLGPGLLSAAAVRMAVSTGALELTSLIPTTGVVSDLASRAAARLVAAP